MVYDWLAALEQDLPSKGEHFRIAQGSADQPMVVLRSGLPTSPFSTFELAPTIDGKAGSTKHETILPGRRISISS
jgi:hypothetical protein